MPLDFIYPVVIKNDVSMWHDVIKFGSFTIIGAFLGYIGSFIQDWRRNKRDRKKMAIEHLSNAHVLMETSIFAFAKFSLILQEFIYGVVLNKDDVDIEKIFNPITAEQIAKFRLAIATFPVEHAGEQLMVLVNKYQIKSQEYIDEIEAYFKRLTVIINSEVKPLFEELENIPELNNHMKILEEIDPLKRNCQKEIEKMIKKLNES